MTEIPEGYALYYTSDYLELVAPTGQIVKVYEPEVRGEEVRRDALRHRAIKNPCVDWEECPICADRRKRGLIA